ncbi:WecD Histone acetyltransferase HPA2 and related acetyltransferases [Rhabdaerophilaceae bacterium]
MIRDGYTDLGPGRLAALTTYLRHDLAAVPQNPSWTDGFALERLSAVDLARYLTLFRQVGADWLWYGRLATPEPEIAAWLDNPLVLTFALMDPTGDGGLLELDLRDPAEAELVYFGLAKRLIGQGHGRRLMNAALSQAHQKGAKSLMVHTCSLDAPEALAFYQRSGFRPFKRAIEIFLDPRLDGTLPREAAAHIPIIES